jgi:hypothetical protein
VLGGDFETRHPWAGTLLGDSTSSEGAKAFQLCVRTAEQLGNTPQAGQVGAPEFNESLQRLDGRLLAAGELGSLLPRESIRLGSPCDLDALELRAIDGVKPQHYAAKDGLWTRLAVETNRQPVELVAGGEPSAGQAAPALPPLLSVFSSPHGAAASGCACERGPTAAAMSIR